MHLRQQGFTLIQMVFYVAMVGVVLFATSQTLLDLLQARETARVVQEVESEGSYVIEQIAQTVRNAEAITLPLPGASAASLTLDVVDVANDPTVIQLSAGAITITEGAGSAVPLTSDQVQVDAFTVTTVTVDGTPGSVTVSMALSYNSNSQRREYDYTQTFTTSISLR